ncbi:MmcQ/YjbR family DNA-binding protein [Saccharopolyspora indica]|uniref:MmcQ/YjbR family DNA-binding protein n=1 Tax=Saccharopolyspora indica TaxID=1229659 RepID=UPI0022EAE1F5|nr:MmcQ/YjbR family DNA-binding protein [Saccharopolyspora indica]MDA3646790.1 MmcQ/YjbR family DNA-binding protein [Saccharopolyspora indica]
MGNSWDEDERRSVRDRLVELISVFPGVQVDDSHGHTGFLLRGKRFAWLLVDHHGDGRLALAVKAPRGEQESLVAQDGARYFVPAYLGPHGWVGANLDEASDPDWAEIAGLLEQAWRMSATKRAIAEYDRS